MSEETTGRNQRRSMIGVVSSNKMDKTIKVTVQRHTKHPVYQKRVKRRTVYTAHDENNVALEGDTVEIMETRKLSKSKCWRLLRVLKHED